MREEGGGKREGGKIHMLVSPPSLGIMYRLYVIANITILEHVVFIEKYHESLAAVRQKKM